ncbi:MAG: fumarylacetoacetase [Bryobacteraceae bacterium]
MSRLNETHDRNLRSWEPSANAPGCNFPIQNLPYGVFRTAADPAPRVGVAIGDFIFDLHPLLEASTLDPIMALSAWDRRELRRRISRILSDPAQRCPLTPMSEAEMLLPAAIGDYTDFYASIDHATNVGRMFRPDNPLLPNYKWVPIAYHGRASSIVVSGTPVRRPSGQLGREMFGPTRELDYELEVGAFLGPGNKIGEPIPIAESEDHLFGVCLLNDWSARDIQRWEYQPLGPFLSKSFCTSMSPWVVTLDALEPFRRPQPARAEGDPAPLPYLTAPGDAAFDIGLEVLLQTRAMTQPVRLSHSNFVRTYWTLSQMIAHHSSNGCPLRAGDLIASGTVSGPEPENRGCLLELTWRGTEPLVLPNGETRTFLEDGDTVTFRGWCEGPGAVRIGLGSVFGTVSQ